MAAVPEKGLGSLDAPVEQPPPRVGRGRERAPRLSATERREGIVMAAAGFFAEHGFSGTTRALADTIGIRQALLYRYFPSKDALVEAVFQRIFASRWTEDFGPIFADRGRPLEDRLAEVYRLYAEQDEGLAVRLFVRAALDRFPVPPSRGATLTARIVEPLVGELRHECRLPGLDRLAMTQGERELVMLMHGAVMFHAIREHVYRAPIPDDRDAVLRLYARTFLVGARETMRAMHARLARPGRVAAGR
ncbi:TetR/AcrR family transcriptional regulator [Alsobacter sp. R-9]